MAAVRRIDRIDRLPFVVARVWARRYQFFDHYCPVRRALFNGQTVSCVASS